MGASIGNDQAPVGFPSFSHARVGGMTTIRQSDEGNGQRDDGWTSAGVVFERDNASFRHSGDRLL
jgi:hypothetical protein